MDCNGTACVGDLGLARLWNGFMEGTAHSANYQWMAPEVIHFANFAPQISHSGQADYVVAYHVVLH